MAEPATFDGLPPREEADDDLDRDSCSRGPCVDFAQFVPPPRSLALPVRSS
jgi:hypothetical protein